MQRHVLYLGEFNGVQEASWCKTVDLFGQDDGVLQPAALFREDFAPSEVGLDEFWSGRLAVSRNGTRWDLVLQT